MTNPFVAEVRIFPYNFAPTGWAMCDGQILPLSQNTALFSLLGTTYGGDGKSNFALPNFQGSAPVQPGQGPGLSLYDLGESGGEQDLTLLSTEMPLHTHSLNGNGHNGSVGSPAGNALAGSANDIYQTTATNTQTLSPAAVSPVGGSQPHNNMMPYLTLTFCIALQGIYPPRT